LRSREAAPIIFHFMPDVETFFEEVRTLVDPTLESLLPAADIEPVRLYQAIRWSVFGVGKRFRPALVIATGRSHGAADEQLLRTAAAVEMIHTYSLIHDDLPAMDDDDLRRGRATAHKKFDEATAILAGDALQAMAFEAISRDESLSDAMKIQLVAELSVAASQMVAGQQLDLESEGKPVDLNSIERIHAGKTAALIRFAVRAGGLIASASEAEMDRLTWFGGKLGLLFQITDDILDVTSTSEKLGKTAGKDATSEKATYPSVLGVEGTRQLADEVHRDTTSALVQLERQFPLLNQIADFIKDRQS
jgi:geranylgeranyl pyrophosphate synthase